MRRRLVELEWVWTVLGVEAKTAMWIGAYGGCSGVLSWSLDGKTKGRDPVSLLCPGDT